MLFPAPGFATKVLAVKADTKTQQIYVELIKHHNLFNCEPIFKNPEQSRKPVF